MDASAHQPASRPGEERVTSAQAASPAAPAVLRADHVELTRTLPFLPVARHRDQAPGLARPDQPR